MNELAEALIREWHGTPYEVMREWLDFPRWEKIERELEREAEKEKLHERR